MISTTSSAGSNLSAKRIQIPRLKIHRPRTGEFASQSFSRTEPRDYAARRHPLDHVLAVPGDEMTIIDVIGFAIGKLDKAI